MVDIKEKSKVLLMYVDKRQFTKDARTYMMNKYTIPSARDRINQYVTPVDFTTHMAPQERGGELVSSLNLSFGDD